MSRQSYSLVKWLQNNKDKSISNHTVFYKRDVQNVDDFLRECAANNQTNKRAVIECIAAINKNKRNSLHCFFAGEIFNADPNKKNSRFDQAHWYYELSYVDGVGKWREIAPCTEGWKEVRGKFHYYSQLSSTQESSNYYVQHIPHRLIDYFNEETKAFELLITAQDKWKKTPLHYAFSNTNIHFYYIKPILKRMGILSTYDTESELHFSHEKMSGDLPRALTLVDDNLDTPFHLTCANYQAGKEYTTRDKLDFFLDFIGMALWPYSPDEKRSEQSSTPLSEFIQNLFLPNKQHKTPLDLMLTNEALMSDPNAPRWILTLMHLMGRLDKEFSPNHLQLMIRSKGLMTTLANADSNNVLASKAFNVVEFFSKIKEIIGIQKFHAFFLTPNNKESSLLFDAIKLNQHAVVETFLKSLSDTQKEDVAISTNNKGDTLLDVALKLRDNQKMVEILTTNFNSTDIYRMGKKSQKKSLPADLKHSPEQIIYTIFDYLIERYPKERLEVSSFVDTDFDNRFKKFSDDLLTILGDKDPLQSDDSFNKGYRSNNFHKLRDILFQHQRNHPDKIKTSVIAFSKFIGEECSQQYKRPILEDIDTKKRFEVTRMMKDALPKEFKHDLSTTRDSSTTQDSDSRPPPPFNPDLLAAEAKAHEPEPDSRSPQHPPKYYEKSTAELMCGSCANSPIFSSKATDPRNNNCTIDITENKSDLGPPQN